MKVILNNDVPNLGEIGDVKYVAKGYARNFLLPRLLAFVYDERTAAAFKKRQAQIEERKAAKRQASASLKEKLEAEELVFDMPAGQNGKLFGAVTNASVADELLKRGIELDRKKIEVPGKSIKSVGNYKLTARLYEKEEATIRVSVKGHLDKKSEPAAEPKHHRHHEHHEAAPAAEARAEAQAEAPAAGDAQ